MTTLARPMRARAKWKPARPRAGTPAASAATESKRYTLDGWEAGALMFIVLVTLSFGLLELYSASALLAQEEGLPSHYFALNQLIGVGPGLLVLFALSRIDYHRLQVVAWPLLVIVLAMLVIVVMPGTEAIAPRVNGARRWLRIGIGIQPSEIAKLALIVWTAAMAVKKQERLHSLRKGLLPFLVVWLVVTIPILLQPNFSTALLVLLLAALVLFAGGARIGHFILLGLVALPLLWRQLTAADYRVRRILAFLDPMADPDGISYQIHQSLIAVGSGGITGVGFGGSRQKFGFLPEPHNDFLFAMVAEEWGFIGVGFTLLLFLSFALVAYRITRAAPDLFGYLLGLGMTNLIVVSALLHMGVSLALLPATGVNLPFMSYGRSGLLVAFAAVGVILSVERAAREKGKR